jgi:hypothetical protein
MAATGGRLEHQVRPDAAENGTERRGGASRRARNGLALFPKLSRSWVRSVIGGLVVGVVLVSVVWTWPSKRIHTSSGESSLPDQLSAFFGPQLRARNGGSFGLDRIDVQRSTGTPFGYSARVTYPAYSSSVRASTTSEGITVGGSQLYLKDAAGPTDHAFLRYYLRIPAGFNWVKGGKLPGLYGGTVTSGRKIPDGTDGLSTRYMWRAGGAGEVYAYLPTSKEHGTSLGRGDWHWPTNQWTCVEQEVTLNDVGKANGTVNVWLNNKQVLAQQDLTFRSSASLHIEGLFFSTFFGGGDQTWATPIKQHADFADFEISHSHIGC